MLLGPIPSLSGRALQAPLHSLQIGKSVTGPAPRENALLQQRFAVVSIDWTITVRKLRWRDYRLSPSFCLMLWCASVCFYA